jgi:hypothetical protein
METVITQPHYRSYEELVADGVPLVYNYGEVMHLSNWDLLRDADGDVYIVIKKADTVVNYLLNINTNKANLFLLMDPHETFEKPMLLINAH